MTNEIGVPLPSICPLFPFDHEDVARDTALHLAEIQRKSRLEKAGLDERLAQSKSFTLTIQGLVAEGSPWGMCTVYKCEITSIDDRPVEFPTLCLKLFDDRFQVLRNAMSKMYEGDVLNPRWFDELLIAEAYALNEAFAYEKLQPVQGSVVPWFYGTHQFTLPNGMVLYGLLMEYIEGKTLSKDYLATLSAERQIDTIRSIRHSTRVLDVADISQNDWHVGQIIFSTNPKTNRDHAVLIDFGDTTQTWDINKLNYVSNYVDVLGTIVDSEQGFDDLDLVWMHLGRPDSWDPVWGATVGYKPVYVQSMFPFIDFYK